MSTARLTDARRHDFFIVDNEVIDDYLERILQKRRAHALAVYCVLCRHANAGGVAWPGVAHIAQKTGLSRPTVIDATKELARVGLIGKEERANGSGGQKSNVYTLLPVETLNRCQNKPSTGVNVVDTNKTHKNKNDLSNDKSADAKASPAPPMGMGQFGIKELAERTGAAREQGATIHSTTDRERRDFGAQFKQAAKDGHDMDDMLYALDYMVAKAAGEIEGEPKAWCGYRTALDRVLDGWRPKARLRAVMSPEHEAMVLENERMEREMLEGLS